MKPDQTTEQSSGDILGVYAGFYTNPQESAAEAARREANKEYFKNYLWGADGSGGLSKALKVLRSRDYGKDVNLILLQFNVSPIPGWPRPAEGLERYRPKGKSFGSWIAITEENFFARDESARQSYIQEAILDTLNQVKRRIAPRKLDTDIDKLIADTSKLLDGLPK